MYSWWQSSEIGCAYQIRILPRGGVEAGRAPSCRPPDSLFSLNGLPVSTSNGFPVPNLVRQVLQKQFIANRFKIPVSRNRTKEAQARLQGRDDWEAESGNEARFT